MVAADLMEFYPSKAGFKCLSEFRDLFTEIELKPIRAKLAVRQLPRQFAARALEELILLRGENSGIFLIRQWCGIRVKMKESLVQYNPSVI